MIENASEADLRSRFGHHATAGIVSSIIIRGMGIVLVKILSIYLSKDAYGTYALWLALVFLLSTISTSPFSATMWRYLQRKKIEESKLASKLFSFCFTGAISFLAIIYIGLFLLYWLFGFVLIDDAIYIASLVVSGIMTMFYILKELVLVVSGSEQNSREIFTFNMAIGLGSNAVALITAIIFQNYFLVLVGLCVGFSGPVLLSLYIKSKQYGINKFDRNEYRLVVEYGGPIMIANSLTNAVPFLTGFLVSVLIGLSSVGTLSIAQTLSNLLVFLVGPILTAYYAYMVMNFETADFSKGNELTSKLVELFISFVTPLVWIAIVFSDFLIELISTTAYLDAIILLPFTFIAAALISVSQFWKIRIDLVQKTYITAIVYVIATIVLVVSSVIMLELYGLIGIGFGIVLHSITVLCGLFIAGNRNLPVALRSKYFSSWAIATAILLFCGWFIISHGISSIIAVMVSIGLYITVLIASRGLNLRDILMIIKAMLFRERT